MAALVPWNRLMPTICSLPLSWYQPTQLGWPDWMGQETVALVLGLGHYGFYCNLLCSSAGCPWSLCPWSGQTSWCTVFEASFGPNGAGLTILLPVLSLYTYLDWVGVPFLCFYVALILGLWFISQRNSFRIWTMNRKNSCAARIDWFPLQWD